MFLFECRIILSGGGYTVMYIIFPDFDFTFPTTKAKRIITSPPIDVFQRGVAWRNSSNKYNLMPSFIFISFNLASNTNSLRLK